MAIWRPISPLTGKLIYCPADFLAFSDLDSLDLAASICLPTCSITRSLCALAALAYSACSRLTSDSDIDFSFTFQRFHQGRKLPDRSHRRPHRRRGEGHQPLATQKPVPGARGGQSRGELQPAQRLTSQAPAPARLHRRNRCSSSRHRDVCHAEFTSTFEVLALVLGVTTPKGDVAILTLSNQAGEGCAADTVKAVVVAVLAEQLIDVHFVFSLSVS